MYMYIPFSAEIETVYESPKHSLPHQSLVVMVRQYLEGHNATNGLH